MSFEPHIMTTGVFKMGASAPGTDYSAEVSQTMIKRSRDLIEVPATAASGRKEKRAGAISDELTLFVIGDLQATSLWQELYTQIDDADGQRFFSCLFKPGLLGVTNPLFSGTCIVTGVEIGGAWGGLASSFTVTMPIIGVIGKVTA